MRTAVGPAAFAGRTCGSPDGAGKRLEQTVANMRTTMLHYALTLGLGGALAFGVASGGFEPVMGTDATGQVTQYCAPEQDSDVPEAPRIYCGTGPPVIPDAENSDATRQNAMRSLSAGLVLSAVRSADSDGGEYYIDFAVGAGPYTGAGPSVDVRDGKRIRPRRILLFKNPSLLPIRL
jgi:hypothetical protein